MLNYKDNPSPYSIHVIAGILFKLPNIVGTSVMAIFSGLPQMHLLTSSWRASGNGINEGLRVPE